MFAKFELYSKGLVKLPDAPARARVATTACALCRRRKRRCDDLPQCSQCSAVGRTCVRTISTASFDRNSKASVRDHDDVSTRSRSISPRISPKTCASRSKDVALYCNSNLSRPISELPLFSTQDLPSCSLLGLLEVFDQSAHGYYLGSSQSMLSLAVPLFAQSPFILHTWISCSAEILQVHDKVWQEAALSHRNSAIMTLKRSLETGKSGIDQIWVMMMLHLSQKSQGHTRPCDRIHLKAAYAVFAMREDSHKPEALHEALLLESLMYHISIARVFAQDLGIPNDAMQKLQEAHKRYAILEQEEYRIYCRSLFCGLTPSISQLLDQVARSIRGDKCLENVVCLQQSLRGFLNNALATLNTCSTEEENMLAMMPLLYLISAQILHLSASEYLGINPNCGEICQALFNEGATRLASMLVFPTITLFPLTIIGTLAVTTDERNFFKILLQVSGTPIPKSVQCVLELWEKAWQSDDTDREYQTGIIRVRALSIFWDSAAMESVML